MEKRLGIYFLGGAADPNSTSAPHCTNQPTTHACPRPCCLFLFLVFCADINKILQERWIVTGCPAGEVREREFVCVSLSCENKIERDFKKHKVQFFRWLLCMHRDQSAISKRDSHCCALPIEIQVFVVQRGVLSCALFYPTHLAPLLCVRGATHVSLFSLSSSLRVGRASGVVIYVRAHTLCTVKSSVHFSYLLQCMYDVRSPRRTKKCHAHFPSHVHVRDLHPHAKKTRGAR